MINLKIKWYGQSSFLITSSNGEKIVTDPFNKMGYKLPDTNADIVTISHNHSDHNNHKIIKGDFLLINEPGSFEKDNIIIKGISTFHDDQKGKIRGNNIIFNINVDGINICHCGDLGHLLTDEQIADIGTVDILLLPVGGTFTIDAGKAHMVIKQLNPLITIPMHYRTKALGIKGFIFGKLDNFLALADEWNDTGKQEIELNKETIKTEKRIIVLNYE